MDFVNYLPLDFGEYTPEQLAGEILKASNISLFWQNWLRNQREVLGEAAKNWFYLYDSRGIGLKKISRPKERALYVGQKDSKNDLSELIGKLCQDSGRRKEKDSVHLIDATAGLLNDTHSMLRLGYALSSYEVNPLLSLLIFTHFLLTTHSKSKTTEWEFVPHYFSVKELEKFKEKFTVLLYDPMFDSNKHKSLPSLEMQVLSELGKEFPTTEITQDEFMQLMGIINHVIVKRPDKSNFLFNIKPSFSMSSKLLRWDIYTRRL
jgi:hypothetical protein